MKGLPSTVYSCSQQRGVSGRAETAEDSDTGTAGGYAREGVIGTRARATGGYVRNGHLPKKECRPSLYVHLASCPSLSFGSVAVSASAAVPGGLSVLLPEEG